MSKYADDLARMHKDIGAIRKQTKVVIKEKGDLVMKELYDAQSYERIKKKIMEA